MELEGDSKLLAVLRLQGDEELSKPFELEVTVALPSDAALPALLGKSASLRFDAVSDVVSTRTGYVDRVAEGKLLANGNRAVTLSVRPHLYLLAHRRRSRIFQEQTTLEIATAVAAEHGVTLRGELLADYPKRVYCVQHEESDLAFLERLFADEGLAYLFEDVVAPGEREAVVLIDDAARYAELPGDAALELRVVDDAAGDSAMSLAEHHVTRFVTRDRVRPGRATLREYDFRRPLHPAEDRAPNTSTGQRSAGWYEHHGAYGEDQPKVDAKRALEAVRRDAAVAKGRSLCRRLRPGRVFALQGEGTGAKFAVTRVRHEARADADTKHRPSYENRFSVVDAATLSRPARPLRRIHQVLETATVAGPKGETIYTDEFGRVKVQFHWDEEGVQDERSSCWLRIAKTWAGSGWGSQFIPRVGMEVIVGFLGGDIDRPVVMGAVDNATHLSPFALPEERTRSGIRTQSIGRGERNADTKLGYNELSFEDAAGSEQVRLRAQQDMTADILRDQDVRVGRNHALAVAGKSETTVAGATTVSVRGETSMDLGADLSLQTKGNLETTVRGDMTTSVLASRHATIRGGDATTIGADATLQVRGAYIVRAESRHSLAVGTPHHEGEVELRSTGTLAAVGEKRTVIAAGETLVLECGSSSIEITPSAIILRASEILFEARDSLTAKTRGPSFELTDTAVLSSESLFLRAKSGSLELGEETILRGKKIELAPNTPKPATKSDPLKDDTQTVRLKLSDEHFRPYANKHFEARAEATKLEGTTSVDGIVSLEFPKAVRQASVTVWLDAYPTGRRKELAFEIGDIPSIDLVSGIQTRLKNLGYYQGATNGDRLDAPTIAALCDLQEDHGRPRSGHADRDTLALIVERYGS
ncbi:MAG: type VI secretion system tip protein TssI/VgrG [Patescibacteria group bacterium]